jgi:23S rRNA pseudouridine2604 synthase
MTMQKPPARTPVVPASPASGPSGAIRRAPAPAGTLTRVAGPTDTIRLNKRMAERGLCSRREADDWIAKGWVKVNGQVATMGLQVKPTDRIEVDKKAEGQQATQVTILLNKPIGYVSGQAEDGHEARRDPVHRAEPLARRQRALFLPPLATAWPGPGRAAGHRLHRPAGAHTGRPRGAPAHRRRLGDGKGIPGARELPGHRASPCAAADERPGALRTIHENDPVTTNVQAVFPPAMLARLRHGLSLDGQPLKPPRWTGRTPSSCASC